MLVIEVCHATLAYYRGIKVPLYAKHGIPEVWLIDLNGSLVHYRNPRDGEYSDVQALARPVSLSISVSPDALIDVSGIF